MNSVERGKEFQGNAEVIGLRNRRLVSILPLQPMNKRLREVEGRDLSSEVNCSWWTNCRKAQRWGAAAVPLLLPDLQLRLPLPALPRVGPHMAQRWTVGAGQVLFRKPCPWLADTHMRSPGSPRGDFKSVGHSYYLALGVPNFSAFKKSFGPAWVPATSDFRRECEGLGLPFQHILNCSFLLSSIVKSLLFFLKHIFWKKENQEGTNPGSVPT